jgi:hypothetical protein
VDLTDHDAVDPIRTFIRGLCGKIGVVFRGTWETRFRTGLVPMNGSHYHIHAARPKFP